MRRLALTGCLAFAFAHVFAADFEETTVQGIAFIRIPVGSFTMGTSDAVKAALEAEKAWTRFEESERPAHKVTISDPFLIGKYEVTQKQWSAVMGGKKGPSAFKGADLPVDSVSWDDVKKFLTAINKKSGKQHFRLPTEAEWEYCCRAGGNDAYGVGKGEAITAKNLGDYAWFAKNAGNKTHPVGTKKPNAWGLYDMQGNVWEWCQDWYSPDFYTSAAATDPKNKDAGNATERVMRGGSWFLGAPQQRAAMRSGNLPDSQSAYIGFRLVCELGGK